MGINSRGTLERWNEEPPHEVTIHGVCWKSLHMCVGADHAESCGWCDIGHVLKPGQNVMPPASE